MQDLTIDQKIELLKIASNIDAPINQLNSLDETIKNYKKLLEAIA